MTKPGALNQRSLAYSVVGTQIFVATLLPTLFLIVDEGIAVSVFIGCWIATLSNAYFGIQAFRYSGARSAQKIVQSFYRGEAGKFIINIVLIAIAFEYVESLQVGNNSLHMFMAFTLVHIVTWFAPIVLKR